MVGREDPEYVVGTQRCKACEELERHRATRHKGDERAQQEGLNPDSWRVDTVYLKAEAEAVYKAQHPD